MVSTRKIHELADQLQKSIKSVRRIPVEYIEMAIEMVDDAGYINLEQAKAIAVQPLVEARLAEARKRFNLDHSSIRDEVSSMFGGFSKGTRRSKVDAVYAE